LFTGIKRSSSQDLLAAQDTFSNQIRSDSVPSRRVAGALVVSLLATEGAKA